MTQRKNNKKRFIRKNFTINPELLEIVEIFQKHNNIMFSNLVSTALKVLIVEELERYRQTQPDYIPEIDLNALINL